MPKDRRPHHEDQRRPATAASELHAEIALLRLELVAFEARLRRNLIAWILIAHSVTVIVLSLLVLTLERSLR